MPEVPINEKFVPESQTAKVPCPFFGNVGGNQSGFPDLHPSPSPIRHAPADLSAGPAPLPSPIGIFTGAMYFELGLEIWSFRDLGLGQPSVFRLTKSVEAPPPRMLLHPLF